MKNKRYLALILSIFLVTRVVGLGNDISNTDAYRWHKRSQNFLAAVKSGDFKSTYQHYQPGVTIMWINAFVKQVSFTTQYHILGNDSPKTLENADWYPIIHGISKAALVLVLAALLFLQIRLIYNLFGENTAFLYGLLISVEPYLIGIDRWFHLTSLETYFGFTSFLYLLYWYEKPRNKKLILSGLFFTLSVLSKITTVLTAPLYLTVILYKFFENKKKNYKILLNYLIILSGAVVIPLFLFFPALLTNFNYVTAEILRAGKNVVNSSNQGIGLSSLNKLFFYDFVTFFKLSPITLTIFIASLVRFETVLRDKKLRMILAYLLFYYVALSVAQKKIDRYVIAMFPSMILMGAAFLSTQKQKIVKMIAGLSGLYLLLITYMYYPVYSAYYSPLFGGTQAALKLGIYDNSGEYFAQAAKYLNTKGRDIKVFVPHGEASFDYYFKGQRVRSLIERPDFVVVSLDTDRVIDNLGCGKFEQGFGSRVAEIVNIFECVD